MTRSRLRQVMLVATLVIGGAAVLIAGWTVADPQLRLRRAPDREGAAARFVSAATGTRAIWDSAGLGIGRQSGTAGRGRQASVPGTGPVLVDGRTNPEGISDATAAAMLLPMLAPSPTGAAGHEKRRQIMLADAGYSAHDRNVLQEVLSLLHQEMDERRREAKAAYDAWNSGSGSADAARAGPAPATVESPTAVAAEAFARLQRELSPDGAVRLRQQLTHIKSNTKILPVMSDSSRRLR